MIYMCFDFGTFSWGVAVGDSQSQTAEAVAAVKAHRGDPDWSQVDQLVQKWRVEALVIGYPLKSSGERFRLTDKVDLAVKALNKRYPDLRVYLSDEHLTTVEAKDQLYANHGKKGLEKGKIDAESAKLILLRWFENQSLFF